MDSGSWHKHVVTAEKSTSAVARVVGVTRSWRNLARRNGCKEAEADIMGRVVDERVKALSEAFG